MLSALTLPTAKPSAKLIPRHHGFRRRPRLPAGNRQNSNHAEESSGVSAIQAFPSPFLPIIPRSSQLLIKRHASAGAASALFSHGDDNVRSDSTPARSEVDESGGRGRPCEDGSVSLFIDMLGLHNDPLDRELAVSTLWRYSQGGKDYVDGIMQFPGCINLIISLLMSDSSSASEAAAGLLRTISSVSIYRDLLAESGTIEEIAGLLSRPSLAPEVKEQAIGTLWNLSIDAGPRDKIANTELLPALIKSLDEEEITLKEAAGGTLANMSLSANLHGTLAEAGIIPKLAKLLKSDAEEYKVIRKEARNALMELCKDKYNKILVLEEGLILVPLVGSEAYKCYKHDIYSWPSLPDGTELKQTSRPSKFGASELLIGLSIDENSHLEEAKTKAMYARSRQQFLVRSGAIETGEGSRSQSETPLNERATLLPLIDGIARLVLILELEDVSAISRAAHAIGDAAISEHIRDSFKEAGAVKKLVQLLKHKDEGVRESVTYALERLSISDEVCQVIQAENLQPLFSVLQNMDASKSLKEKTVNILARILNPGKIMKDELFSDAIDGLFSQKSSPGINASQEASNSLSKPLVTIWENNLMDLKVIPCLVELLRSSLPNMQRKIASILEYITRFDELSLEISNSDIESTLIFVFEQRCPHGGEYEDEVLHAVEAEECSLVVSAASKLLIKLLDSEQFQSKTDLTNFVELLRKILKSNVSLNAKDWVAACLVKIEALLGLSSTDKYPIDIDVTLYETIPRLVENIKMSVSIASCEVAIMDLNRIISEGMIEYSRAFSSAGGIYPLVELIDQLTGPSLEAALAILYNLSMDSENHAAIISAGAVPVLKRIILADKPQWSRALGILRILPI